RFGIPKLANRASGGGATTFPPSQSASTRQRFSTGRGEALPPLTRGPGKPSPDDDGPFLFKPTLYFSRPTPFSVPVLFPSLPFPFTDTHARAHADESVGQRARDRDMSAVSWSIPAIPRAIPPARSGPPGEAFLVAARPRAARSRAAPRRVRLARGGVVVAHAGAAEVPVADSGEAAVVFSEKFPLRRCQT
uniref:Uncharacterized protein n=1 Tax=Aegilops tauschii subsp. strangulata TaxID=200361 RepID=A0A453F824_AEGTS